LDPAPRRVFPPNPDSRGRPRRRKRPRLRAAWGVQDPAARGGFPPLPSDGNGARRGPRGVLVARVDLNTGIPERGFFFAPRFRVGQAPNHEILPALGSQGKAIARCWCDPGNNPRPGSARVSTRPARIPFPPPHLCWCWIQAHPARSSGGPGEPGPKTSKWGPPPPGLNRRSRLFFSNPARVAHQHSRAPRVFGPVPLRAWRPPVFLCVKPYKTRQHAPPYPSLKVLPVWGGGG